MSVWKSRANRLLRFNRNLKSISKDWFHLDYNLRLKNSVIDYRNLQTSSVKRKTPSNAEAPMQPWDAIAGHDHVGLLLPIIQELANAYMYNT